MPEEIEVEVEAAAAVMRLADEVNKGGTSLRPRPPIMQPSAKVRSSKHSKSASYLPTIGRPGANTRSPYS